MLKRIDLQIKQQSHGLDSKLNQQDLLSLNPPIILYMIEFFTDLSWTLWFSAAISFKRRSSLKVLEKTFLTFNVLLHDISAWRLSCMKCAKKCGIYQTNERMHFVLSAVPSLWNFSIPVETLFKNE